MPKRWIGIELIGLINSKLSGPSSYRILKTRPLIGSQVSDQILEGLNWLLPHLMDRPLLKIVHIHILNSTLIFSGSKEAVKVVIITPD